MENKKQNDSSGWRNKLDALDSLPGEAVVEKNEAWEKLQARLQERPRSKKTIWYWAAAAILLVLLMPVLIKSNKENNLGNSAVIEQPKKLVNPDLPAISNHTVAVVQSSHNEKKPVIISNARTGRPATVNILPKENNQPIAVIELPVETKKTETITAVILPDTIAEVAAAVPVNKKMKIVHINDLETFPLPFYSSGKQAQKAFRIKIGNNSNNQSSHAAQEYTSGLQIKLPFKN